jgi:type IV fimbrial biogenesis protein FimT
MGGSAPGFTLIELLVTMSLAAVLLGVAAPNMVTIMRNGELASDGNDLIHSLQLARTEAVKRQKPVVWCASTNPLAGTPTCGIGGQMGWIVFEDDAGTRQYVGGEPLIQQHDVMSSNVNVKGDGSGAQSYTPLGFAAPPSGGFNPTRNIVICDSRGNQAIGANSTARAVLITATGRARVSALFTDVTQALATIGGTCP